MRTTLFNTMRTILYNRFALHLAGDTDNLVYAAGDDVLCWARGISTSPQKFKNAIVSLLGNHAGIGGLGQVAKDFLVGRIQAHSFLSKRFHTSLSLSALFRLNSRAYKAGACMPAKVTLSLAEYRKAQESCAADLPSQQDVFRTRWAGSGEMTEKALQFLESDYGTRLRLRNGPADEDLSPQILFFDNPSWIMKALRVGRAGGKPSLRERPQKFFASNVRNLALRAEEHLTQLRASLVPFRGTVLPSSCRVVIKVIPGGAPPTADKFSAILTASVTKPRFTLHPTGSLAGQNSSTNSPPPEPLWTVCPVVLEASTQEALDSLVAQATSIEEPITDDEEDLEG